MNEFSTTVEEREKRCHVVSENEVLEFFNRYNQKAVKPLAASYRKEHLT